MIDVWIVCGLRGAPLCRGTRFVSGMNGGALLRRNDGCLCCLLTSESPFRVSPPRQGEKERLRIRHCRREYDDSRQARLLWTCSHPVSSKVIASPPSCCIHANDTVYVPLVLWYTLPSRHRCGWATTRAFATIILAAPCRYRRLLGVDCALLRWRCDA